jgi:hypothetical protein
MMYSNSYIYIYVFGYEIIRLSKNPLSNHVGKSRESFLYDTCDNGC